MKDEAPTIFRRRRIGFVFQSYNLVPVLNVYENIVAPILVILPLFLLIGLLVPLAAYKMAVKRSVVERLQEAE